MSRLAYIGDRVKAARCQSVMRELRDVLRQARVDALTFSNMSPAEQAQMRGLVRAAVLRNWATWLAFAYRTGYFIVLGCAAGIGLALWYVAVQGWYAFAGLAGLGFWYLLARLMRVATRPLPDYIGTLLDWLALSLPVAVWAMLQSAPALAIQTTGWLSRPLRADSSHLWEQVALGGSVFALLWVARRPILRTGARRWARSGARRPGSRPYDSLVPHWARTLAALTKLLSRRPSSSALSDCVQLLNSLSADVLVIFPLAHLDLPGVDRRRLKDDARRISESVRAHGAALLADGAGQSSTPVLDSLYEGLAALAVGDRERLLRHLPPARARLRPRDIFQHVFPALVLGTAGVVLPLIPAVSAQGTLAGNLRITLLVMAALSLVSAPNSAVGRIEGVLGKALPLKGE